MRSKLEIRMITLVSKVDKERVVIDDCFTLHRQIKEMKWPDLVTFFIFYFLFTQLLKQNNSQGGARAAALQARSFDLVRTGVAPPLTETSSVLCHWSSARRAVVPSELM